MDIVEELVDVLVKFKPMMAEEPLDGGDFMEGSNYGASQDGDEDP